MKPVLAALRPFLFTRLVVFAILIIVPSLGLRDEGDHKSLHVQRGSLTNTLKVADAIAYQEIALKGYGTPANYAFFPVWSLVLLALGGNLILGALVANILFFLALLVLYKFHPNERTITYLCLFPTSYFFSLPLTESLFLLLAVGAFQWSGMKSGIANALASATRITGIFVLGRQWWLAPTGLIVFMVYLYFHNGDPLAFSHAQVLYGRQPSFFLTPIIDAFIHPSVFNGWSCTPLSLATCALAFMCGGILLKRREWRLAIYTLGSIVLALSSGTLTSIPRYAVTLFPVFMVMSDWGKNYWVDQAIKLLLFAGLVIMTTLYALHVTFAIC